MKNQYFGDKRDLFKYDLWLEIAKSLGIKTHTFIPMLTPSDSSQQGGRIPAEAENYSEAIFNFLAHCRKHPNAPDEKRRNIKRLRAFFRCQSLKYHPYRDTEYLKHDSRDEYFSSVPKEMLECAAILIDPDIGLERKGGLGKKQPEKYVKYTEIACLANRCSEGSVILLFQFLAGGKRVQCLNRMADRESRLRLALSRVWTEPSPIPWVAEGRRMPSGPLFGDVAFFLIAVGRCTGAAVNQFTRDYAGDRVLLYSNGECVSLLNRSSGIHPATDNGPRTTDH
ncbi:MAG TPA: hypothetical protein VKO18_19375 [Terriglobia bacterium]|nr:hypothetical protein [Terriglobia bacterium]